MLNYDQAWCMYYDAKKVSRDAIRFPEAPPTYADYEGWFYDEWNTNISDFNEAHHKFSEATHADPTGDHGDEPQPPYPDDAVTALKASLSSSLSPNLTH